MDLAGRINIPRKPGDIGKMCEVRRQIGQDKDIFDSTKVTEERWPSKRTFEERKEATSHYICTSRTYGHPISVEIPNELYH